MDLAQLAIYAQVALGIGLVIFVHELGHFLAARACGVRVEVFSLGFGPRLFGWKRGPTTYQLALLPLGGFVRMAGEDRFGSGEGFQPDELGAKSVGQRFLIFSGGVLMNVVFGLIVFPLVLFYGVPFEEPVIGRAIPGGPAWESGLAPGTRVLEVNGQPIVGFHYIANEVALGPPEGAHLLVLDPGAEQPRELVIQPRYDKAVGFNRLEILPAYDASLKLEIAKGSAAERAGLQSGDRLVGVGGALSALPLIEQLDEALSRGGATRLSVQRDGKTLEVEVAPDVHPGKGSGVLGVSPVFRRVQAVRGDGAARELLKPGDLLMAAQGEPHSRPRELERALLAESLGDGPAIVRLRVQRDGREVELESTRALEAAERAQLIDDAAVDYDVEATVIAVSPSSAAERAGLEDGDRILSVGGRKVERWEEVRTEIKAHRAGAGPLSIEVERIDADGRPQRVALAAELAPAEIVDYGLGLRPATYVYRAGSLPEAVRVGFQASWKFVVDAWLTLKRILFGQVSSENIGGIITIAAVSYSWAEEGLAKLFFILCMLSMNLAFINVLPIPVLDGGHLFFLLIEKIKGSPVSERVLSYSQVVGVVLILSLMIYVTYNDLVRWVFRS
jgi:regulator of sigma E protease